MQNPEDRIARLRAAAAEQVLVIDGAMGTMIQNLKYDEDQFRGDRFQTWNQSLQGDNDLLNLTQPFAIRDIHDQYLDAGADIVKTNTFNATSIAQADYGMEAHVAAINLDGARLARAAADASSNG